MSNLRGRAGRAAPSRRHRADRRRAASRPRPSRSRTCSTSPASSPAAAARTGWRATAPPRRPRHRCRPASTPARASRASRSPTSWPSARSARTCTTARRAIRRRRIACPAARRAARPRHGGRPRRFRARRRYRRLGARPGQLLRPVRHAPDARPDLAGRRHAARAELRYRGLVRARWRDAAAGRPGLLRRRSTTGPPRALARGRLRAGGWPAEVLEQAAARLVDALGGRRAPDRARRGQGPCRLARRLQRVAARARSGERSGPGSRRRIRSSGPRPRRALPRSSRRPARIPARRRRFATRAGARSRTFLGDDGVLLLPTVPTIAPKKGIDDAEAPALRERIFRLTCIAPMLGFPQVTLPLATVEGCPMGISLLGPAGRRRDAARRRGAGVSQPASRKAKRVARVGCGYTVGRGGAGRGAVRGWVLVTAGADAFLGRLAPAAAQRLVQLDQELGDQTLALGQRVFLLRTASAGCPGRSGSR